MRHETRRAGLLFAIALVAGCGGGAVATDAPRAEAGVALPSVSLNEGVTTFVVDGVPVIHKVTPGSGIVELRVILDGGAPASRIPGADQLALGVATFGGPSTMTRSEYAARLDAIGATISSSVGLDYATLSVSSIASFRAAAWALFAETLRSPALREDDFALRHEQALSGLATEHDDPDGSVASHARASAFVGHPYARRPQGTAETVSPLTRADLEAACGELFVRARATVVVVGNVERAAIEEVVRSGLGGWAAEPSRPLPAIEPLAFPDTTVTVVERDDLPTNYVLGYFAAPPVTGADYAALQIATAILADRLFEEVRTKRNLSYAVSAGLSNRRAPMGYLYVTAVDPSTTVSVMLDTVGGLVSPGVSEKDLRDQIEGYLTTWYQSVESNAAQAGLLTDWTLVGGGRERADEFVQRLHAVTPADVARVTDTYIRAIQWVVVGARAAVDDARFTAR